MTRDWTYAERVVCPLVGEKDYPLYTKSGEQVATGYTRVVIGGRGPYVEFTDKELLKENLYVPNGSMYRLTSGTVYYDEYRTNKDFVMVYRQKKTVAYADYKKGMWYISPFDLYTIDGTALITPINKKSPEG